MHARTMVIYLFGILLLVYITNVELRFLPNDTGHCDIKLAPADSSCRLLSFKNSYGLIFNSSYYLKFKKAVDQYLLNAPGYVSNSSGNRGQTSQEEKSLNAKTLQDVSNNLAAINDEM